MLEFGFAPDGYLFMIQSALVSVEELAQDNPHYIYFYAEVVNADV